MECIFCKIARKEIPADIVHENSSATAFLDRNPIVPGHTLVVPKEHVVNLTDLPTDIVGPVFLAVQAVVKHLDKVLAPDGFTIGINHGRAAGQAIDHFHIHVLPRWAGDHGATIHGVVKNPPASYDEVKQKIMGGS